MKYLRIEPAAGKKGRTFTANLLGYVMADMLWEGGKTSQDIIRPAWICYASSENEARAFTANMRMGRKALVSGNVQSQSWGRRKDGKALELLKSGDYEFSTQRFPEGLITTAFLPELFRLDPGMVDPKGAKFVVMPSVEWGASQAIDVTAAVRHLKGLGYLAAPPDPKARRSDKPEGPTAELAAKLALLAPLFAAYLDRRTRAPLIKDALFHVQVLVACLRKGLASLSLNDGYYRSVEFGQHTALGYFEDGLSDLGMLPGVAFSAYHHDIEPLLAQEAETFLNAKS